MISPSGTSPAPGRGWGSLPGRCSGPFRPISTPGGRCCSLTGLGPHTVVLLPCPGAASPGLRQQPAPGVLSHFPPRLAEPGDLPPSWPRAASSCGTCPLVGPPQDPGMAGPLPTAARHTQIHTPTSGQLPPAYACRLDRVPGRPSPVLYPSPDCLLRIRSRLPSSLPPHLSDISPLCLFSVPHASHRGLKPLEYRSGQPHAVPDSPSCSSHPSSADGRKRPLLQGLPPHWGIAGKNKNKKGAGRLQNKHLNSRMASTEALIGLKSFKTNKTLWKKARLAKVGS